MKIDWKQRKNQLILLLLAGVLLVVIALPAKEKEGYSGEEGGVKADEGSEYTERAYGAEIERKLENILREVEGAGKVKVMVTFQSSTEKIVEKDKQTDEKRTEETTVYRSASGGEQTPYITKEIKPKVEGIVILAEGGGNAVVVKNITEAVQALFDVEIHKIKVMKRNQTN